MAFIGQLGGVMASKKAFPLWEQTKEKYVKDLWSAQGSLIRYKQRKNHRDLEDLKSKCINCWMNIRSYRDLLSKKNRDNGFVTEMEKLIKSDYDDKDFEWWCTIWMFLNDSYKKLGIDDVGKREDEDDWKTAALEGLFD